MKVIDMWAPIVPSHEIIDDLRGGFPAEQLQYLEVFTKTSVSADQFSSYAESRRLDDDQILAALDDAGITQCLITGFDERSTCGVTFVHNESVAALADRYPDRFIPFAGAGPKTAVYVCGPTPMLEAVRVARDEYAGAPLHYERFSPPPVVDGIPFELELARSQRVLSVPANRSALDVMLDRDPTTAYSCQQGFCGTCKVKVLAGQVDHRGRTTVDDDEMLVCVSRAKGDRVVIDA